MIAAGNSHSTGASHRCGSICWSRRTGCPSSFRTRWAAWYRERLAQIPWLRLPTEPTDGRHSWQSFVTFVDEARGPCPRNEMMQCLETAGIGVRPGTHAVHTLGLYRGRFGYHPRNFPGALACAEQCMAIPLHNRMTADDFERVAATLESIGGT